MYGTSSTGRLLWPRAPRISSKRLSLSTSIIHAGLPRSVQTASNSHRQGETPGRRRILKEECRRLWEVGASGADQMHPQFKKAWVLRWKGLSL